MADALAAGREPAFRFDRIALGLALALLVYWLAWVGAAPLFDVDEGAFAEASREMLAGGDWLHTTLNGADRFDKPILIYWFQAAAMAVFGVTEFATRLPSATFAWGWCVATAAFVGPRWGRRAALLSAAVLATSVGAMLIGRAATADALLNLLLALTCFDLLRFIEASPDAKARVPLRRAALWTGLGLLAKGPIALLVPGGVVLVWLLLARREALRGLLVALRDGWSWALMLLVSVPWYAYAVHRHGRAFIEGFLMRHNVERFTGTLEHHGGALYYYVLVLPLLALPWTPVLVGAARDAWRQRRASTQLAWLLFGWFAFVLVFFSFSGTKLPHYMLYGFTPLAVGAGVYLSRKTGGRLASTLVCVLCALLIGLGVASPQVASMLGARQSNYLWRALTDPATMPPAQPLAWAALALLAVVTAAVYGWLRPARRGLACAVAALATTTWFNAQVVPWWGETLQGPVKHLSQAAALRGRPLVQSQLRQPSAGYYRGEPVPAREPAAGEVALTRDDRLQPLLERGGTVVRSERGLALVQMP